MEDVTADELLEARFQTLFRGRDNAYGQYWYDLDNPEQKNVKTVPGPIPQDAWTRHIAGDGAGLGVVPIREDNSCYWGAIDVDDDGVDLSALAAAVAAKRLPLVVCRSKSGGAHLYLFLMDPAPATVVQGKLREFRQALNVSKNHDGREVEIFPKQRTLARDKQGNWINLPYYHAADSLRYAVNDAGERLPFADFLWFAESRRVSSLELEAFQADGGLFHHAPPCLQTLDQLGLPPGARNQGLFNIGVYLKLAHPDDWKERLEAYNQERLDPPKAASELRQTIESIDKRDYAYKCSEEPIVSHCEKSRCRRQKFGIGAFAEKARQDSLPLFGVLQKVKTDPPRWVLPVNGVDVELATDDLSSLIRFRKVALERLSVLVPMMKVGEWDDIVRGLLATHVEVDAPEDAGVLGLFTALLTAFLELRKKAKGGRDDVLQGLPVEDEGRVYFRSQDLLGYLEKRRFRDKSASEVYMILRGMGGSSARWRIKNVTVRVWSVPVPDGELREPLDVPAVGGDVSF